MEPDSAKPIIIDISCDETTVEEHTEAKFRFWLIRAKTNETVELSQGEFKLGKSNVERDYVISGNSGIGRLHAKIIVKDARYFATDNSSINKIYFNSEN